MAVTWVLWQQPAIAAFLVLQPGACFQQWTLDKNQAINGMCYCRGLMPQLSVKAKTVLCLALSTYIWP